MFSGATHIDSYGSKEVVNLKLPSVSLPEEILKILILISSYSFQPTLRPKRSL
ncbi:hypothetical protein Hdeb2414_s0017g00514181 [Helianthus debilis subsp. tardiflorus]